MQIEAIDLPSIVRRIRTNVGILLGATGIAMMLGLATVALNARALGADGLGIIALFQASAAILTGLFYIGSQQPMIRLGRQAIEDHRKDRVGVIAGLAILVDVLAALLAGLCALTLISFVPGLIGLSDEMRSLALVYSIVIFLSGNAGSIGILRLLNRFRYIGTIQVVDALLIFAAAGVLFLNGAALGAYIVAYALIHAATAAAHVVLALMVLRRNGVAVRFSPQAMRQAGILHEYFAYAWTTSATSTLDTLRRNTDALLLGTFFGPAVVGIYSVVRQVASVFNKVMVPVSSAVFPEVAALAARNDQFSARKLLNRLAVVGIVFGASGVLLMALAGGTILELGFGAEFGQGYFALIGMMVAAALNLSGASFGGFVQAFHSPKKLLHVYLGSFLLYVLSAPPLTYLLDVLGAALGQIAFALTLWMGCWGVLARRIPQKIGRAIEMENPLATNPKSPR